MNSRRRLAELKERGSRFLYGCIAYAVYVLIFELYGAMAVEWAAGYVGPAVGLVLGPVALVPGEGIAKGGAFWVAAALLCACWAFFCGDDAHGGLWLVAASVLWFGCGIVAFIAYAT